MTETETAPSTTSQAADTTSQLTDVPSESPTNIDNQVAPEDTTQTNTEPMTVDDLMGLTEEQYPSFNGENHTGMRPLHEVMKHLPEDARKHLANIRRSYTTKTQELADQRREMEQSMALHKKEMSLVYDNDLDKRLTDITSNEDKFDIYSEEGMKQEIQKQAAIMMQAMLAPAKEKIQMDNRRLEMQQFKNKHPDLTDPKYKMEIAKTLTTRPELRLEDAYYIVKARVDSSALEVERRELAEQRNSRRESLLKSSSGTATSAKGTPRFKNAYDAYLYHKQAMDR